jgi:hypothetical protein
MRSRLSNPAGKFGPKSFSNCLRFHGVHSHHIDRSSDVPQLSVIGDFAFYKTTLCSVAFAPSPTGIDASAFQNWSFLVAVVFPRSGFRSMLKDKVVCEHCADAF